jgi:hypothetical protein
LEGHARRAPHPAVYLSLSADPTHAFATVTAAFAVAALLAGGMAWRATH